MIVFMAFISSNINADTNLVEIGEINGGNKLYASEIKFNWNIVNASINGNSNIMSLVITKESDPHLPEPISYAMMFNFSDRSVLWNSGIKGNIKGARTTRYGMLVTTSNDIRMLDIKDGTQKWSAELYPAYIDDSLDVLIGYTSNSCKSSKIKAVKASTGELLWQGKVKRNVGWGWDDAYKMDDGRIIVIGDDINVINLLTGDIKTFEAKTGYRETGKMALALLGSAALSVALYATMPSNTYVLYYNVSPNGANMGFAGPNGFLFAGNYGPNTFNGLSSNILKHNSHYYIADRDSLRCFSDDMQPVWQYAYPTKKASASYLISENDNIYMLNYGYGLSNGVEKRKNSRPFIASVNQQTGEQTMFCAMKMKKDIIEDSERTEDGLLYMFDDGMAYQKNINDTTIEIIPWENKKYGKLKEFVRDTLYAVYEETGGFTPIVHEEGFFNVQTNKGYILKMDSKMNIITAYPEKDIYRQCFKQGKHIGIYRPSRKIGYDVWIVREQGFPEMHITQKVGAIGCTNDYVYIIDENTIRYFSLENCIPGAKEQ